jgi:hypothetical protein
MTHSTRTPSRPLPRQPNTPSSHPQLAAALTCCAALLLCATSCAGTDVGNPADDIRFQFTALDPANALTLESGLVIDEAWVVFRQLRLWKFKDKDKDKCTGTDRVDITGLFAVELISGRELPQIPAATADAFSICRLDIKLANDGAATLPSDTPSTLANASIWLKGSLPDGRPFSIQLDMNEMLSLKTISESVTLGADIKDLLLTFDFATWITADTLAKLQNIPGDEVIITPKTSDAGSILSALKKGIKAAIKLSPDTNKDGRSQANERAQTLAESEP